MIQHNAFHMFLINMGIVLLTAYFLDKYATFADKRDKTNKRTENVLD